MKNFFFLLAILMMNEARGQDSPEYIRFMFTDSNGQRISPALTIYETRIYAKNDRLQIKRGTYIHDSASRLDRKVREYVDDSGRIVTSVQSVLGAHNLGQEVRIVAAWQNRKMEITFFGQGMWNFNCWNRPGLNIIFRQGYYHYYYVPNTGKDGFSNPGYFLVDTKKAVPIFTGNRIHKLNAGTAYYPINLRRQFEPVDSMTRAAADNKAIDYTGFFFTQQELVGAGMAQGNHRWFVKISKEAMVMIKKYYHR